VLRAVARLGDDQTADVMIAHQLAASATVVSRGAITTSRLQISPTVAISVLLRLIRGSVQSPLGLDQA